MIVWSPLVLPLKLVFFKVPSAVSVLDPRPVWQRQSPSTLFVLLVLWLPQVWEPLNAASPLILPSQCVGREPQIQLSLTLTLRIPVLGFTPQWKTGCLNQSFSLQQLWLCWDTNISLHFWSSICQPIYLPWLFLQPPLNITFLLLQLCRPKWKCKQTTMHAKGHEQMLRRRLKE